MKEANIAFMKHLGGGLAPTWHEDQENIEGPNNYLNKDSKVMAALRKIVLDPKWLKTLHFYVRFR